MIRRTSLAAILITVLGGCSQNSATNTANTAAQLPASGGGTLLSSLRPHASAEMIEQVRKEEAAEQARRQKHAAEALKAQQGEGGVGALASASGSMLPSVSQVPFAPSAEQATAGSLRQQEGQKKNQGNIPFWPFGGQQSSGQAVQQQQAPQVATYGSYGGVPPPPPGAAGGLVPPPPAVSVTGTLAPYGAGAPPVDPYGNPYTNPYAQQAPPAPTHPQGSFFSSGGKVSADSSADESSSRKKKQVFVPILPSGMDSRSPYKQRDDLKVLWKGAVAIDSIQRLIAKDEKIAAAVSKIDVGLPVEATKGSLSASQRQIDSIFKPAQLDKKVAASVKQLQGEVVQSYYRYLYSYNKFALLRQTVAARKQEVEFAQSASEQQRAAADQARAQSDADESKEDMRSAEQDLAGKVGAQAARVIIGRVTGVTPSAEALAVAETAQSTSTAAPANAEKSSKGGGVLGGLFGFGKGQKKDNVEKTASAPAGAARTVDKSGGKKNKKVKTTAADGLAPAPEVTSAASAKSVLQVAAKPAAAAAESISFELKKVDVTPRKSILQVCIRNRSSANFSFDPDNVSILEGNHRLSEATVRTDFDTTLIEPNQEVVGTITIFGHPWNDRLSVALSDGNKTVQLKR